MKEKPNKIDDVGFISALIYHLAETFNIDRKRIYAIDISNGGLFSQHLACELTDKVAAIASVASTRPQNLSLQCKPSRPISVILIHGTSDPLVLYNGGEIGRIGGRGLGGKVLSVAAAIKYWIDHDKCSYSGLVTQLPDKDADGTRVRRDEYDRCSEGASVVLYTIENGGHTWPGGYQYFPELLIGKTGRDINASEIIWEFFKRHPMR